ncbi:MAG TPA: recombination protein RecR [Rhodospirillaceae bacterium]|nr:recombination protein RecR [Candidatus Neomarinimicrobiota bacterium]HCX13720.1 recombination protein RecR [Rhodospirillaceae bacterium]
MAGPEIEALIRQLSKLPGLGPRSARRLAFALIKRRKVLLDPLIESLRLAAETVKICSACGNYDSQDPCAICIDPRRDGALICVVEDVADLWALERTASFRGKYHVTGGRLSPLDGIGPDDLRLDELVSRVRVSSVKEIILALSATVDGQTTAHYIAERLQETETTISGLAHGVPIGGELDYLDDGTIAAALKARRPV